MIRDDVFFTSISEKNTLSLLLAIKDLDRPVILKELQSITNHTQTLRVRLDEMEEDGLVDVEIVMEPRKKVVITLTDLGREVSLLLSMADSFASRSTCFTIRSSCQNTRCSTCLSAV